MKEKRKIHMCLCDARNSLQVQVVASRGRHRARITRITAPYPLRTRVSVIHPYAERGLWVYGYGRTVNGRIHVYTGYTWIAYVMRVVLLQA